MLYVTLGDQPSGIYDGQVIDVCQFIHSQFKVPVRLVSFISLRDFSGNKLKIKAKYPNAIVVPMFPKLKYWYLNKFVLAMVCLLTGEREAICRNVLATKVALSLKAIGLLKKVCFDGRGAIAAEWEEYEVVQDLTLKKQISELEKEVILKSDFQIGVSNALVQYWKDCFGYSSCRHVVIPCTVSSNFKTLLPSEEEMLFNRQELGYSVEDIILVYAGSTAGWQSFGLLQDFLSPLLSSNRNIKVLFLSKEDESNKSLEGAFPAQVSIQWVGPDEVNKNLTIADYGILLREDSITNRVASPTKFAEYLISGLPVLISPNLGDYTQFVQDNSCGIILFPDSLISEISPVLYHEKKRLHVLGKENFMKSSPEIKNKYQKLVSALK